MDEVTEDITDQESYSESDSSDIMEDQKVRTWREVAQEWWVEAFQKLGAGNSFFGH